MPIADHLAPVSLLLLAGCASRDVSLVELTQSVEQRVWIPISYNRDIDILFVVDDSGSMKQEQSSLIRNFPRFVQVLEHIEGGLPNIHLGVISSNLGTSGGGGGDSCSGTGDGGSLLRGQADTARCRAGAIGCSGPCPALTDGSRFIKDIRVSADSGDRAYNYTMTLADQFSCMAELGTRGCGFEQHLESMKRALDSHPDNGGFLRPDAFLAVIFVQDEDDCSARSPEVFRAQPGGDSATSELGELSSFRCFEFGTTCEGPSNERQLGPRQNCKPEENSEYMQSVQHYVDFLKDLKGDPSKVIVAAVAADDRPVTVGSHPGPGPSTGETWVEPQCVVCPDGSADGCPLAPQDDPDVALVAAAPSIRMKAFLEAFPQRATLQTICNYNPQLRDVDLSGALTQIAQTLHVFGNPCLPGALADPIDCAVSDVQNLSQESQVETLISPCDSSGGTRPCYRLVPDPSCVTETNLTVIVDRDTDPPPNTTLVARCLAE
jgi:hypothetical protein